MSKSVAEYEISDGLTEQDLVGMLKTRISITINQTTTDRLVFFDTFDWRLFEKSLLLYQSKDELVLQHIPSSQTLLGQPISNQPKFIRDFPGGKLKKRLEPIVEMRALLKLGEADLYISSYCILNDDEKTVARLTFKTLKPHPQNSTGPIAKRLVVTPVRGYGKSAKTLIHHLEAIGLEPEPDNLLVKALEAGPRTPGDYLAGLKVKLDPGLRADEATKIILRPALRVMELNEEGIKKDIDTEFLHDFRVAVRRTRSVLSQVKGVFSEETTLRFKRDFAVIGKLTNELRDLDVYLLAEDNFKAMLPDNVREDINPLFEYMRQKRAAALQNVIDGLNSAHYRDTLQAWDTFLNEPAPASSMAVNATTPIMALAQNRIYKKYRRIVKRGSRVLDNIEDEQLHALRIECKKLRYLMNFFQSLFPRKKINTLIKQVKKLQINLGDFNDLCVQEVYLLNTPNELTISGFEAGKTFVAIGCLVGAIQQERAQVKANFAQTFTQFARPANQKLFRQLFATEKRVKK